MYPGGGRRVRGRRPELRAELRARQRPPDPQGHAALGHGRRVAALHQDGAAGRRAALLRRLALDPAQTRRPACE